MNDKIFVFVYGTLRKHEPNHFLLKKAKCFTEQSSTTGVLYDTGCGFPALTVGNGRVYGELYLVTESELEALDQLEGCRGLNEDNFYNRIVQTIYTDRGEVKAYVYVISEHYRHMLHEFIESGDWRVHQLLKRSHPAILYFAYGSCMDNKRFKVDKVDHYFNSMKGRGILEGYSLRFTRRSFDGGKADIVEEGGKVEGKVYELPAESLDYLFRREGVRIGCYRPTFIEVELDGEKVSDVLTFVVIDKEEETAPSYSYAEEIIRGGEGVVSEEYLTAILSYLDSKLNIKFKRLMN